MSNPNGLSQTPIFDEVVRTRSLQTPMAWKCDVRGWLQQAQDLKLLNARDQSLVTAALWIHEETQLLSRYIEEKRIQSLGSNAAKRLGIALTNREVSQASAIAEEQFATAIKDGALDSQHLTHRKLRAKNREFADIDSLNISVVDTLNSLLFDFDNTDNTFSANDEEVLPLLSLLIQTSSYRHSLDDLWQNFLWRAYLISKEADSYYVSPPDIEFHQLEIAWHRRAETISTQRALLLLTTWEGLPEKERRAYLLPRRVSRVKKSKDKGLEIFTTKVKKDAKPSAHSMDIEVIRSSYLSCFINKKVPKYNFDIHFLLCVWSAIRELAINLCSICSLEIKSIEKLRDWDFSINPVKLCNYIVNCLNGADKNNVEQAIQFLTYETGQSKGLWGAPLVKLSDGKLAIALGAMNSDNTIRRVEIWMQRSGLDKDIEGKTLGDYYERHIIDTTLDKFGNNQLVDDYFVVSHPLKKGHPFNEQIDMLLRIGRIAICVEIKNFLYPSDPVEMFNHYKKCEEASLQAIRKAEEICNEKKQLENILHADQIDDVIPLVLLNHTIGSSLCLNGAYFVDENFWKLLSADGGYNSGGALSYQKQSGAFARRRIYRSQSELETKLRTILSQNPPTEDMKNRIGLTEHTFQSRVLSDVKIRNATQQDYSGRERDIAQQLHSIVS